MSAIEAHRACTAPDLTPEQFLEACRFEASPAACLCGRCDTRGTLRIDTAGVEEWVPCRTVGGLAYLPDRDKWKR